MGIWARIKGARVKAYKYIRTNEQIKYLILTCMKHLKFPLTFTDIYDTCSWCDEGFTYFDLRQAFDELYEKVLIYSFEKDDKELFWITEAGKEAALIFQNDIPNTVRKMAEVSALRVMKKVRRETEITSKIEKAGDDDYQVTLTMQNVIEIKMSVVTYVQASALSENFKKSAEEIFQEVLTSIIKKR